MDFIVKFTEWEKLPLTSNRQPRNVYAKNRIVQEIQKKTVELTKHFPPMKRIRVHVTWWVNVKRKRDTDNLQPTLKPIYDGLVKAGIVPDDSPKFMDKPQPQIVLVDRERMRAHLEIVIEEIA